MLRKLLSLGLVVTALSLSVGCVPPAVPRLASPTPVPATPLPPLPTPTPDIDRFPPEISDLEWQPIRVVNNKVYDARVVFEALDDGNGIACAQLTLVPKEYGHLPEAAFPVEGPREFVLEPLDGAFDEREEEFVVEVTGIVGGREYDLVASVKDQDGNAGTARITTPYVREFENIAPLDDILVTADYYTWYETPPDPGSHWDDGHVYAPLLDEYTSADPVVISRHIDWATGHAIDAFLLSWWSTGKDERQWDYHLTRNLEAFLQSPLIADIRFAILYENNGRMRISNPDDPAIRWIQDLDDPFNRRRLISDLVFLADHYFQHPSYLRIEGRPLVDFDYTIPFRGNIAGAFAEARETLDNLGVDVYLVNDLAGRATGPYDPNYYGIDESHLRTLTQAFDAVSASNFPGAYDEIERDIEHGERVYRAWREYSELHGKDFIPAVWPGHQGSPAAYPPPYVPLVRTPMRLASQIALAKRYATTGMISVISFNEWTAGHQVEPSEEEGAIYLEALRNAIAAPDITG